MGDQVLDRPLVAPSRSRQLIDGANSALFIAVWLGIVYAQVMVAFKATNAAAHCSLSLVVWNAHATENATMAVVVIAAAGMSGYLVCARRKDWGAGALVGSIILCGILTALVALLASVSISMLLSEPVFGEEPLSAPLTIIVKWLTVLPGLAAINTLVVCWALRRSSARPWGAAWSAGLVPAVWFALAIVVFLTATAAYC
ncbi:hypothetical protein ACX3O0_11280 [Homoserinimonas sp. A447]